MANFTVTGKAGAWYASNTPDNDGPTGPWQSKAAAERAGEGNLAAAWVEENKAQRRNRKAGK